MTIVLYLRMNLSPSHKKARFSFAVSHQNPAVNSFLTIFKFLPRLIPQGGCPRCSGCTAVSLLGAGSHSVPPRQGLPRFWGAWPGSRALPSGRVGGSLPLRRCSPAALTKHPLEMPLRFSLSSAAAWARQQELSHRTSCLVWSYGLWWFFPLQNSFFTNRC